ncbi:X8 domain-containing protein, partial [Cephalotus follicularis]
QNTWCIANPVTTRSVLSANLNYACSHVDCHMIQRGGSCYNPNTYMHHASFAMNLYYQNMGRHISDCNFRSSGLVSLTDPTIILVKVFIYMLLLQQTWCVAKPGTNDQLLLENLNYACNIVDCSPTQNGGPCFTPTTILNHASFAMNLYYQNVGRDSTSTCDFNNTGLIVTNDPSK